MSVDSLTFNFTVINRSKDTDDTLNDTKRRLKVKDLGFDVSSQHFMSIYQHVREQLLGFSSKEIFSRSHFGGEGFSLF